LNVPASSYADPTQPRIDHGVCLAGDTLQPVEQIPTSKKDYGSWVISSSESAHNIQTSSGLQYLERINEELLLQHFDTDVEAPYADTDQLDALIEQPVDAMDAGRIIENTNDFDFGAEPCISIAGIVDEAPPVPG